MAEPPDALLTTDRGQAMTTTELRALMNAPGPVGPSSPIVAAALVALPRLLDVVEAAERWEHDPYQWTNIRDMRAAVAKWREG